MCKALKISKSSYYEWLTREPSNREERNKQLSKEIKSIHQASYKTYGSPRIYEELRCRGIKISRRKVAKMMKRMGLRSQIKLKYKPNTTNSKHNLYVAPHLLNREFKVDAPSKVWVSDLTYIETGEGWLYLTVVIDLYDRKVIGWALSETMHANETTIAALKMAILNRKPTNGLIFHSDRGVQYACADFVKILDKHHLQASMSRKGNCWDNAVAESFFKTIKVECIYRTIYATKKHAKADVFSYIEIWYNLRRRHSALNYATPLEMEQLFFNSKAA